MRLQRWLEFVARDCFAQGDWAAFQFAVFIPVSLSVCASATPMKHQPWSAVSLHQGLQQLPHISPDQANDCLSPATLSLSSGCSKQQRERKRGSNARGRRHDGGNVQCIARAFVSHRFHPESQTVSMLLKLKCCR